MTANLEQRLTLQERIKFNNLLKVPDELIQLMVTAITLSPCFVENALQKINEDRNYGETQIGIHEKIKQLYSLINNSSYEGRSDCLNSSQKIVAAVPSDVTYLGRSQKKPKIIYSSNLKEITAIDSMHVDKSYPNTLKFLKHIRRFDKWKREKLREIYQIIGNEQREFFESLKIDKLNPLYSKELAKTANIHIATLSRILSHRWFEAESVNGEKIAAYAKSMIVNPTDIIKYSLIPKINAIFEEEFENKKAYSDEEIAKMSEGFARRTLFNYRIKQGIPNKEGRYELYKSGKLKEPFSLPLIVDNLCLEYGKR